MPATHHLVLQLSHRALPLMPGQTIAIGRSSQCELHLDDPAGSRRHCTIEYTADGLHLRDLDSVNGTFVNDGPVRDAIAAAAVRLFERGEPAADRTASVIVRLEE